MHVSIVCITILFPHPLLYKALIDVTYACISQVTSPAGEVYLMSVA